MSIGDRRVEFVGPKVGKELQILGLKAILYSLVAMFIYIWLADSLDGNLV